MNIIEFNADVYKKLRNKKVCLVEKSVTYLDELCDACDILPNIAAIVDENRRKCGTFLYQDSELVTYPLEYLLTLDFEKTVIVITSDYYREYVDKIEALMQGKQRIEELYVFYNYETRVEMQYRKRYEKSELQNIIVFRSGPHSSEYVKGMDFSDNARALFEYMLSIEMNKKYELVWLVKEPKEFRRYDKYQNVFFLPYEGNVSDSPAVREGYYRVLCLAKYIFFTDAYGFARNCREDQIRVQLWHGCGYKTRLNYTPCEKRYEYMTVTSELYADIHAELFGLRKEQMLITGCAKADWLFQEDRSKLAGLCIPQADKYIFWLPTYRFSGKGREKPQDGVLNEETGLPLISTMNDLIQLNRKMAVHNIVLVIKLHPFQDKEAVHCDGLSNIVLLDNDILAKQDIQINQLLSMADALISDYSSAAVDYVLLNRPMGFIVDDMEEYAHSRGFIFDNILEWLPGKCILDRNDFEEFIEQIICNKDWEKDRRQKLCRVLHKNSDAESCQRIVEELGIV